MPMRSFDAFYVKYFGNPKPLREQRIAMNMSICSEIPQARF